MNPYIRWLEMNFAIEDEGGSLAVSVYGDEGRACGIGRLFGALILGVQADRDMVDIVVACDDCDGDLREATFGLEREGALVNDDGSGRDVFYIHSLELNEELIGCDGVVVLLDRFPRIVFQLTNVTPQVLCYLAADDGYYESRDAETGSDSRAADARLMELLADCDYVSSGSGKLLYRVVDDAPTMPRSRVR